MDKKQQPDALRLAEMLTTFQWPGSVTLVRYAGECAALLREQHARITELESQLAQRFDAADMATAAAQGFRDGVASLSANAVEPRNAIARDALIDAIAQGLHGTWHCTRVWESWHVGTMSQDDFEPVDDSETPTEIADAVLALLAAAPAQPAAQQGAAYAALPTSSYAGRVHEEGFLIGTCPLYTADQLHAFADATHALRASHGQAPAGVTEPTEQQILEAAEKAQPAPAQADSVQEDAARLDFLIEQRAYVVSDPDACPGYWLHWARPDGSTWVQGDEHPTPRAAIDAGRKQGGARWPSAVRALTLHF